MSDHKYILRNTINNRYMVLRNYQVIIRTSTFHQFTSCGYNFHQQVLINKIEWIRIRGNHVE